MIQLRASSGKNTTGKSTGTPVLPSPGALRYPPIPHLTPSHDKPDPNINKFARAGPLLGQLWASSEKNDQEIHHNTNGEQVDSICHITVVRRSRVPSAPHHTPSHHMARSQHPPSCQSWATPGQVLEKHYRKLQCDIPRTKVDSICHIAVARPRRFLSIHHPTPSNHNVCSQDTFVGTYRVGCNHTEHLLC
jgi:hypothetical protein